MKNINKTVFDAITEYYNNALQTGTTTMLDVQSEGVLLPMETSRFNQFTKAQYDAIYSELVAGNITILRDTDADSAEKLPVELVTVVESN